MRRIWVIIGMVAVLGVFMGCGCVDDGDIEEYTIVRYRAPNWTSDNKIVFVKDSNFVRDRHTMWGIEGNIEGSYEVLTLCEINSDGSGYKEIGQVCKSEHHAYSIGINGVSSAGDWVVFDLREEEDTKHRICVMRRDGSDFYNTGVIGMHPDFSPDGSKIVYEKPDSGIWIMNRDGSNNHCIVPDADAKYPAWSPDDSLIGYLYWGSYEGYGYATFILDITSDTIFSSYPGFYFYDWGEGGTDEIFVGLYWGGFGKVNINTGKVDTINMCVSHVSMDGDFFIGEDKNGYFVCRKDGSNKWYLKDLIE